jgi:hypothetical protein
VLLVTWARRGRDGDQALLDAAYAGTARAAGARLAPVGPAWRRALADHPELALHREDGSHPAPAGTYLAACVLVAVLTGRCPIDLPVRTVQASAGGPPAPVDLPAAEARLLQRLAWATATAAGHGGAASDAPAAAAEDVSDAEAEEEVEVALLQ